MKPLPRVEAEALLRDPSWRQQQLALKRLPDDIDPALVVAVAQPMLTDRHSWWVFCRSFQRAPAPVVRALLDAMTRWEQRPAIVYLREAVDAAQADSALRDTWTRALLELLDLQTTYAWGSRQKKAKLQALAKQPRVVAAIQAAVVNAVDRPPMDMLAVLAIEASDASVDALLPHFAKQGDPSRLEQLATHATRTPALEALLSGATSTRKKRERESPALAFVRSILGDDAPTESVEFCIGINSVETPRPNAGPTIQGQLRVDSKADIWWRVHLGRLGAGFELKSTGFGAPPCSSQDDLGLGACSLEELPAWLAKTQKKLKVHYAPDSVFTGSVRGKKRDRIRQWLFGVGR